MNPVDIEREGWRELRRENEPREPREDQPTRKEAERDDRDAERGR